MWRTMRRQTLNPANTKKKKNGGTNPRMFFASDNRSVHRMVITEECSSAFLRSVAMLVPRQAAAELTASEAAHSQPLPPPPPPPPTPVPLGEQAEARPPVVPPVLLPVPPLGGEPSAEVAVGGLQLVPLPPPPP